MKIFKRDGYWHVEYLDKRLQRLRRKSLRTKNKNEALKALTAFKEKLSHPAPNPIITLANFKDEYTAHIRNTYSEKYLSSVELAFRKLTSYLRDDIILTEFTRPIAERFLASTFSRSKYAAHLYYRTLKAAMTKAISWGYITDSPFKGVKLPKVPTKKPAYFTIAQLNSLLRNIEDKDIQDIVTIAFYTGMRLSEVLNLKWNAVNLEKAMLTVQNNKNFTTKSKHERLIPMHKTVLAVFHSRTIMDTRLYVFSKRGVLYNRDFISKKVKKGIRKSGLPEELHFHSLRHSFASNLVQKGVSLYVVKDLLGHESIMTTQVYSHLQKNALAKAINVLK